MHEVTARIEIPTRTILKVLLVLAALWFFARIGPVIAQVFAGIVLAMALYPPVARLQRRGFSKGQAIAAVFGGFIAGVTLVLWFLVPELIDEGQTFVDDLPDYVEDGTSWLEGNLPWLHERLVEWAERQAGVGEIVGDPNEEVAEEVAEEGQAVDAGAALSVGQRVGDFLATASVAVVLAIYFLVDGDRAFRWLARDLSPRMVRRVRRAAPALSAIVGAYVAHQVRMSVFCGVYSFVVLTVLDVPSAMILATIAALTDAVPLIGVVMATVPAVVVALTQGWETALAVLVLFVAYQVFENYVLIPRLLGRTFQLSSFGMLMAVLIGWQLAGLVGVLLALPTAAALLVLERVWLEDEADREPDETAVPGPIAIAAATVAVVADAVGDDQSEAPEAAEGESAPRAGDRPVGPPAAPAPSQPADRPPPSPAPGQRPAAGGVGRRGGQRRRPGGGTPGTAPG